MSDLVLQYESAVARVRKVFEAPSFLVPSATAPKFVRKVIRDEAEAINTAQAERNDPTLGWSNWNEAEEDVSGQINKVMYAHPDRLKISTRKYNDGDVLSGEIRKRVESIVPKRQIPVKLEDADPYELDLMEWVVGSVEFDLTSIVLTGLTYQVTGFPKRFIDELLEIYESGRLPCGWEGHGEQGGFIVLETNWGKK